MSEGSGDKLKAGELGAELSTMTTMTTMTMMVADILDVSVVVDNAEDGGSDRRIGR